MGVLDELGYEVKPSNALQRGVQNLASTKPVAWMFQKSLYPVDKLVSKATKVASQCPGCSPASR